MRTCNRNIYKCRWVKIWLQIAALLVKKRSIITLKVHTFAFTGTIECDGTCIIIAVENNNNGKIMAI